MTKTIKAWAVVTRQGNHALWNGSIRIQKSEKFARAYAVSLDNGRPEHAPHRVIPCKVVLEPARPAL